MKNIKLPWLFLTFLLGWSQLASGGLASRDASPAASDARIGIPGHLTADSAAGPDSDNNPPPWEQSEFTLPESPAPSQGELAAIRESALKGDAEAELYLGVFYANGNLVGQDYREAAEWFSLSAEHGNPAAMRNLALLYDCGIGVERDYALAAKWYKEAARRLEPAAYMGLARFPLTYSESVLPINAGSYDLFRLVAFILARVEYVDLGMEAEFWRNYYKSMRFYLDDSGLAEKVLALAEQGDDKAQLRMAVLHFQGQGVPLSAEQFVFWLKESSATNIRALLIFNKRQYDYDMYEMFSSIKISYDHDGKIHKKDDFIVQANKEIDRLKFLEKAAQSGEEKYFRFWYNYQCYRIAMLNPRYNLSEIEYPQGYYLYKNELTYRQVAAEFNSLSPEHFLNEIVDMAEGGYPLALSFLYDKFHAGETPVVSGADWRRLAEKGAHHGDLYSLVMRVYYLLIGCDSDEDPGDELSLIGQIAANADFRGLRQLGECLAGKKRNLIAIAYLTAAAGDGDVNAQTALGMYYSSAKNTDAAISWLEKATDGGSAPAMCFLAREYLDKSSLSNDYSAKKIYRDRMEMLWEEAGGLGYPPAILWSLSRVALIFHQGKRYILDGVVDIETFGVIADCFIGVPFRGALFNCVEYKSDRSRVAMIADGYNIKVSPLGL